MAKKVQNKSKRKWFLSRRWFRGHAGWPCRWGFFTDWNVLAIDIGKPKNKLYAPETPEPQLQINMRIWPPRLVVFWHVKRIIWLGDWAWKTALSEND